MEVGKILYDYKKTSMINIIPLIYIFFFFIFILDFVLYYYFY